MAKTVLVAGCGVFGLSTCMELKSRGYNVIAFDVHKVPSSWAASCDINKVIRAMYDDKDYCKMAIEALNGWKTNPVFKGCFVDSGSVIIDAKNSHHNRYGDEEITQIRENFKENNATFNLEHITNNKQLVEKFPVMKSCNLEGRRVDISWDTGYGRAAYSLTRAYNFCNHVLGVEFHFGKSGKVKSYGKHYLTTSDGQTYYGDIVIICCGAANTSLVDFEEQVRPLGEFVTFIALNDEEYKKYKDMPIVHVEELGFYFPPDKDHHWIKFVVQDIRGLNTVTNPVSGKGNVSLPIYMENSKLKGIPNEAKKSVRKLIKMTMPSLYEKPLVHSLICWCANTCDMNWIIDRVPGYQSVFVCGGDSGHGYKFLPNIGRYITDRIEGKLPQNLKQKWAWKSHPKWPKQWPAGAVSVNYEIKSMDWSSSHL